MSRDQQWDPDSARVYAIDLVDRFRGTTVREGVLIQGPSGWGDFCPFPEYDDAECVPWLQAAVEAAVDGWPVGVRGSVAVNVIVPAVTPLRARTIVAGSPCRTAKVKVAEPGGALVEDASRVAAVREALGSDGAIRVDANGGWDVTQAVTAITRLDAAAGGLEYVEQPCAALDDLARVRRRVGVRIAADESIRRAVDPMAVALAGAADIAVIKCSPLGGVRRALAVAGAAGLPVVVSSALESGVGLAAEIALAGALPELAGACGLGTRSLLAGDVIAGTDALAGGRVTVPLAAPSPDPDQLDRWTQRDVGRRRWWLERLSRVALLLE